MRTYVSKKRSAAALQLPVPPLDPGERSALPLAPGHPCRQLPLTNGGKENQQGRGRLGADPSVASKAGAQGHTAGAKSQLAVMPRAADAVDKSTSTAAGRAAGGKPKLLTMPREVPLVMSRAAAQPGPEKCMIVELQHSSSDTCFDGDAGVIGRVAASASTGASLDLKGAIYKTEHLPAATTLLLLNLKTSGAQAGTALVEARFTHFLRATPAADAAGGAGDAPEWSDDDCEVPTAAMASANSTDPVVRRRAKLAARGRPAKRARPAAGAKRKGKPGAPPV